jgi:hypothetical protein
MNDIENRIMDKLDDIHAEQINQGQRIAVNTNDIETLKGSKSWVVNLAGAVGAGGFVAWLTKGG